MRCLSLILFPVMALTAVAQTATPIINLGRPATAEEIRRWDIAVGPAGKELPPGSGTAQEGAKVFAQKCAVCHGPTAEGGVAKRLVGGKGTLNTLRPEKTVGAFWPFATTVWDYINRAMPQNQEGTLNANEVYAVTAFLLFRNEIIQESDVMDAKSLPKVQMPNRNGFIPAEPVWPEPPGSRLH